SSRSRGSRLARLRRPPPRLGDPRCAGGPPARALEPRFTSLARARRQLVGLLLGGVVLPELRPGVWFLPPAFKFAERCPVRIGWEDRAGREADSDPANGSCRDPSLLEHRAHGLLERGEPVAR